VLSFAIAIVALILLALAGMAYQTIGARMDQRRFPPPGRLVEATGHRIHVYELGSGLPSVILESGIAASSLNWRAVQAEVAKFARVCS
jgi:hypothetical protein